MPEPPFPHDAPLSDLSESASAAATGGDHYDDLLYKLEAKNRLIQLSIGSVTDIMCMLPWL